ncbi:hypothetical protein CSA56_06305 [candidate division KSB3 bacterium]|uniref:V-type ATP synthase subunit E n=1 Tax=candidate division KSB3 bacterium TaxID=2044937 RepID=A0A2G6KGY5_9BACT|nr:MAG: hypothetical protein CSA56_06305 [candidate division KSB3 bacterium]
MAEAIKTTSGVQELIGRLKDEGVQAGRQEAERLIDEARAKASKIVAEAREEAERLLQKAHIKNEAEKLNAHESLKVAVRDTEIELQTGLKKAFESHVKRLVSKEVQDEDFLRQLLFSIVSAGAEKIPEEQSMEVLLPDNMLKTNDQGTAVTEAGKERLRNFVRLGTSEMLREGVTLKASSEVSGGIILKLVDQDVVFDFSDNALSSLILKHLLPRYRAIVEGSE